MTSRFHLLSDDVLDEARQLARIHAALVATRASADPASASAAELDELIKLAIAAREDLETDARTAALVDAALGRPVGDFADD